MHEVAERRGYWFKAVEADDEVPAASGPRPMGALIAKDAVDQMRDAIHFPNESTLKRRDADVSGVYLLQQASNRQGHDRPVSLIAGPSEVAELRR
ncbi:MAG: hypothetical protein JJE46_13630 [Acidimicrobiia bacterium]|nr:hypothetical protein [Acidimicrobiia bacterium]